ncbi:hypothetical protein Q5M87_04790, partial [Brachyspira innocens]|uniref:hypothetical protein n=1 Tax=Brachyspira innocens TaxID=13264 RepID=UPI0026EDBE25
ISDIKGFQIIRKKWKIILILREEREEKVIIYNFTKRFEDDRYKLRCLECYWKDLARKMELEEWSNKGLRGLENKLFNENRLKEAKRNVGEMFYIPTHLITNKNITALEFRLLCLIDLMEGFRRNEYIAEILGISLEELIKTVKSLQEKDYLKED